MDNQSVEEVYPYHIVEFVSAEKRPKVRKTDVVATKWLFYNQQKKKLTTRYPVPPYDENISAQLNLALQNLTEAPSTWPTYTVKPRGKAASLEEAFRKHDLLAHQQTALTAATDESETEAEKKAAEAIKRSAFQCAAASYQQSLSKHKKSGAPSHKGHDKSSERASSSTSTSTGKLSTGPSHENAPLKNVTNLGNGSQTANLADLNQVKTMFQTIMESLKTTNDRIQDLDNKMTSIKSDVDKIKSAILDIKKIRIKNNSMEFISTVQQLNKKFNYDIPFKTIEEFKAFDKQLSDKKDIRESVMNVLQSGLDPQMVISRSMVTMMKMFLSKQLAMQCVAVRNIQDKVPIKSTPFYECVKAIIKGQRSIPNLDTTDKDLSSALSSVLSNAVQWYVPKKIQSTSDGNNSTKENTENQRKLDQHPDSIVKVLAVAPSQTGQEDIDPLKESGAMFLELNEVDAEILDDQTNQQLNEEFDESYLSLLSGLQQ